MLAVVVRRVHARALRHGRESSKSAGFSPSYMRCAGMAMPLRIMSANACTAPEGSSSSRRLHDSASTRARAASRPPR